MLLYFVSQEAHQVAGCKGRWAAGSYVNEGLAGIEI
jgi:hypothetical protein